MNDSNIAFQEAAADGDLETMVRLRHDIDIEYGDQGGYTALHHAVIVNSYSVVERLLDMGANINSKNRFQNTPLALCDDSRIPIARLLIQMGANIESVCEYGNTPFAIACMNLNHNLASLLLESGANVNHVNANRQTVLMICVFSATGDDDDLLIINFLLYQGTASIHVADDTHGSLLQYAATNVSDQGFLTIQALINMGLVGKKKELQTILRLFRSHGIKM
jgi:ankyrin repeat protein